VLGTIRHADPSKAKVKTIEKPKSLFTEGFRLIRSRIEFISKRKSDISVLITSAESGDGKTHFAINLSGVYSLVSDKVVLVDIDIRNPKLTETLGYKNNKGLVHVLIGEATLDEVLIKDDKELGYHFLPAGIVPPNPAELVRSEEMMSLLNELKQRYDYRIIDTSPLGLVSDAYALTRVVDVNLLVTRVFKSDKSFFKNFIEQVQQDSVNNPYIVLNDLQVPKNGEKGHYGKYGYGKYAYGNSHYYYQQSAKYYTEDR
jgi:capsular exopolysaccharide synthesis family protein